MVRSLLVPAVAYDIGNHIWWPSKLWRRGPETGGVQNSTDLAPAGRTRREFRARER